MSAIFPVILSATAGSIQCMHGGVFKGTPATTSLMDGEAPALTSGGFTVVTPCPGIAPTVPPCQLTSPALSMSIRVTVDTISSKPVTAITPQISVSNGQPAYIAKTSTTGVKVL